MFAGPEIGSVSETSRPNSISSASSLIVMPLIDSPPFDSIIVRGIAFEAAALEIAEDVDRELLAAADLLHERVGSGVWRRKNSSSSRSSQR